MPVKVNNLTINSSVSREGSNGGGDAEEKSWADKRADPKSYLDDACQTAEQIKAEVLAECKQLIKDSIASRRDR